MSEPRATEIVTDAHGRLQRRLGEYALEGEHGREQVCAPRFRVGSHPGNDLVIAHPSVSRFHVEIVADDAGYALRDLGSTNGTWVDSLRIKEAILPARCRLRLGRVELTFALTGEQRAPPTSIDARFHGVVGVSPAMREIFALLERVAPTDVTVLIEGESGTGKEEIARAVVAASARAGQPFAVLDCAAVPQSLIESELFGHEKGAFTGATARRIGRFAEADGGTLFIDELGELPLELQPRLLRVLETREVRPLGAAKNQRVDVRVIAATNRELAREVNRGAFRADLYYRLAVVRVALPALRDRRADIRPLAEHLVRKLVPDRAQAEHLLGGISADNWARLEGMPWSGNVRELRNFLERTLILSGQDDALRLSRAGPIESPRRQSASDAVDPSSIDLDRPFRDVKAEAIAGFEKAYLLGQLARHDHNISAAARASGLDRMNFKRLVAKYR